MANGLQIQNEFTNRERSVPWITRIEFRTEYEKVKREEKASTIEIVRVADPDDETKVTEKRVPRETTRHWEETVPVDYVSWALRSQSTGNIAPTFSDKVARIAKNRELWPKLEPLYQAWKQGQEAPLEGTPLARWPAITPAQHKILVAADIKTVEDFATAPSGHLMKLGIPGLLEIQKEAIAYLNIAGIMKDGPVPAQIAVQITEMQDENAALKAQMQDMAAALERLRRDDRREVWPPDDAVAGGLEDAVAEVERVQRRGPGRPRKDEQAAA